MLNAQADATGLNAFSLVQVWDRKLLKKAIQLLLSYSLRAVKIP
jgi:hypothetical protein